eukprot:142738_1
MTSILYCGVCTLPPEYCRYYPNYYQCLQWMKTNHPELYAIEIKDISATKLQQLTQQQSNNESQSNTSFNESNELKQSNVTINLAHKINIQKQISQTQISDISSKLTALSTNINANINNDTLSNSPFKSILKNRSNPNYTIEKQRLQQMIEKNDNSDDESLEDMNEFGLGQAGNRN